MNSDGYFQAGNGLLDTNMNAYCGNNPVNYVDPTGELWFTLILAVMLITTTALTLTSDSNPQAQKSFQENRKNKIEEKKKIYRDKININTHDTNKTSPETINIKINNSSKNPNIHIENSYQIADYYTIAAITELTMESSLYDDKIFPRKRSSYIHEWNAHNILYSISNILHGKPFLENFKHADLDNNDKLRIIWDLL